MTNKSILKPISKYHAISVLVTGAIIFTSILPSALNEFSKGEKIKDKTHLETLLRQEKKKLGIENKDINVYFCDRIETSSARKINENSYEIKIANNQRTTGILDHELYHIADGHCDKSYNTLKYFFIYEPQATIYELTGIKF
ncbi:hypothetical protein HYS72_00385 [Candidatus Pacearchaeota archaeon]|nr:hypothetical protein [Candidatus Pacearchaeota archaeon]